MPYGIPSEYGGDTEENEKWMLNCIEKVMSSGKDKVTAIKICKAQFIEMKKKNKNNSDK